MLKRILIALVAGGVLAGAVYGAAAGLGGVNSPNLGAEDAIVQSCDSDGVTIRPDLVPHPGPNLGVRVDGVTIGGLADACSGLGFDFTVMSSTAQLYSVGASLPLNIGAHHYTAAPDNNSQYISFLSATGGAGLNPHDVDKFQLVIFSG